MLRRTSKKVKKLNTYTLFFIIVAQLAFKSRMVQKQLHSQLEKRNPSILKCYNFDAHICTQRGQACQPRREDQCENWKWGKIFLEYLLIIWHWRLNSGNFLTLIKLKNIVLKGKFCDYNGKNVRVLLISNGPLSVSIPASYSDLAITKRWYEWYMSWPLNFSYLFILQFHLELILFSSVQVWMLREIGRAHVWTPVTRPDLVCRLLLEKKKQNKQNYNWQTHQNT